MEGQGDHTAALMVQETNNSLPRISKASAFCSLVQPPCGHSDDLQLDVQNTFSLYCLNYCTKKTTTHLFISLT